MDTRKSTFGYLFLLADGAISCGKVGHLKNKCLKRKAWFEKKGIHYVSVCFESNLIEVPSNTWWLDTGATTHVSHISQGFLTIQPIKESEKFLFIGNRMKAQVEGIGTYRLILDTGYRLDLEKCLYVPECARNLISVSRLDILGFDFRLKQYKASNKVPVPKRHFSPYNEKHLFPILKSNPKISNLET